MLAAGLAVALVAAALPQAAAAGGRSRSEVWRRVRKLQTRYIIRAVGLEGEKAAKLKSTLRSFNRKRSALWGRIHKARRQLRRLAKEKGPDAEGSQDLLDSISRTRLAVARVKHDEFQALRQFLTPTQQARYLRARRRFRHRMRKVLRRIRRKIKKARK